MASLLSIILCCLSLLGSFNISNGETCMDSGMRSEDGNFSSSEPVNEIVKCPRPSDPQDFTGCCFPTNNGSVPHAPHVQCCLPDDPPRLFYFISDKLALLIAVALTVTLLVITVIIVVCCFWTQCPLYMACRVRYRKDDIIAYASKDEETANLNEMPPEEKKGLKTYSLNDVKITPLKDVA